MRNLPLNLRTLIVGCLLALVAALGLAVVLPQAVAQPAPHGAVAAAWEQARASGSYRFRSELTQNTTPVPGLRAVGRPAREDRLSLEGRVDQGAEQLELTLWRNEAGNPQSGISIKIEHGQAFGRQGQGAWQEIDASSDLFAPGGDPLGFLAAARDFTASGSESRELAGRTLRFERYGFRIDGPAFAEHMRIRLEEQLRRRAELPPGVSLQSAEAYRGMAGQGTLWVDDAGLPRRLELQLEMPNQPGGDRISAVVASDFLDFDRSRLALATTRFSDSPTAWLSYRLQTHADALHDLAGGLALCLTVALLLLLSVSRWRTRRFQTVLVLAVISSMVCSPLLQSQRTASAAEQRAARQDEQNAKQARIAAQQHAIASVRAPASTPHQSPLDVALVPHASLAANVTTTDTTDSDGDGLTDSEEALYGTCPKTGSASATCTGVASPSDSDADGISDGVEVKSLGSDPDAADSDGDSISDYLEVNGFSYNSKSWYLNPTEADTNKDGLLDSVDCPVWSRASTSYSATGICPDTDNDKTPNVWDDDDDGDGVLDSADLSPSVKGASYNDDNPLELSVSSLQAGEPVFVDVQIRPTDARQLSYITSMLDWPTGDDEGQIQRQLNTTFASTANTALASTEASAAYGDLRIVPLLEITMPGTSGHYANLPVTSAYQNVARPTGLAAENWLDASALDPYGITVRDVDTATGKLAAYVPLSVVYDDIGGGRVAYGARMLYQPSRIGSNGSADWGAAHEYRVMWLVQMLNDECIDATADEATCARQDTLDVIHIYRDESWMLSGLEIREDHGLNVAILYEDPAQDGDRSQDGDLWAASWNINNTFLRGRDCGSAAGSCTSDGQRDVTVANIETAIDGWSSNSDAMEARSFSYEHQGYLTQLMMTETPDLLADSFTAYAASVDPTLLFAREETFRSMNLETLGSTSGTLSFDLSATNAPEIVQANLSWATYDHSDGAWQNYDSAQNLDRLALQLADTADFQASDTSDDSVDTADGKLLWAQFYYSSVANGLTGVVSANDELLFTPAAADVVETDYSARWPAGLTTGAAFVAFEYLKILGKVYAGNSASSFWANFRNGFESPSMSQNLRQNFKYGTVASNVLMTATTAATIVGVSLFLAGYLSGDEDIQQIGAIVLGATTVVVSLAWGINLASSMASAAAAANGFRGTLTAMSGVSKASRAIGPVGLLIGVVAIWGLFAMQGLMSGLFNDPTSIAFNSALAYAVASTIVLLVLFILDLIPIVGTLIVLAIYIADVFMSWFCKKTCHGGAQAWLTEVIADSLYSVDDVLSNLDSPDRLDFDITNITFSSDEAGYTTANGASFTLAVTNTLKYAGSFSDGDANRSTFRYYLQGDDTDRHTELALNQMRGEWNELSGRYLRATASTSYGPVSFGAVRAGVNRDLGGKLYLTEAYVGPYAGCWLAFGIDVNDCDFFPYSGSNHIDIGSYVVYDILPSSLTTLLLMTWNKGDTMPTPMDPDGDGLVSRASGGADPSDTSWDGDNDGLSDEYELNNLLDPDDTDSDNDGLSDLFEARRSLDPLVADSDDDGMSDSQEQTGWKFGYVDGTGVARTSWVWPDPFAADADGDNLSDLQEFYYGFHPGVATDNDLILNTITFADSSVSEGNAPSALLRFEEAAGAAVFADSSGNDLAASCAEAARSCPTAGATGRYASAAQFDGSNDYLELTASLDLSKFTQAAWIYSTSTDTNFHGVLGYDGGSTATRAPSMYLFQNGRVQVGFGDGTSWNSLSTASAVVTANTWTHVATTFNGTTYTIYVNGVQATSTTLSGKVPYAVTKLRVGRNDNYFKGLLDEVAIYNRALSATEITALMRARYNADDGSVTPGDSLTYNLTINNNSATWPVQATYYGELDESYTGYEPRTPLGEWKLDETSGTSFADSSGHGYSATCTNCPTVGTTGYSGKALQFDGVNDELILDTASRAYASSGFSFGGWVYPTTVSASRYYEVVFGSFKSGTGTTSSDKLDALIYDAEDQKFFEDTAGNTGDGSAPPNQWYHVMVTIDPDSSVERIYLNGVLKGSNVYGNAPVTNGRFRVAGPSFTQGVNTYYPFAGKVDGVTLYDRRLTTTEVQQAMAGTTTLQEPTEQVSAVYAVPVLGNTQVSQSITIPSTQPSGAYRTRQVTEAALDVTDETNSGSAAADPDTTLQGHYDFDDPPGDSTISDSARRLGDGTCTSCPTLGIRGVVNRAARFDGNDLVSIAALDQLGTNYTVAAWVKARDGIIAEDRGAIKPFRLWTDRYDYRKYGGNISSDYYGRTHIGYEVPSVSEWVHVVVTYSSTGNTNAIYLNGVLSNTPSPSCCDDGAGGAHTTKLGQLLNGYLDDVRLYSRTMTAAEVLTLYQTSRPQLQLEFEEDSDATAFEDSTSNGYDATILGAGAGLPGRIGSGGYFDGTTSYATIASAPAIGSLMSSLTIMGWVKPTTVSGTQRFVASGRTASNNGMGFGLKDGKLLFSAFGVKDYTSSATLSANTWQHVAVVFDAGYDAKFYLNGVYIDTVAGNIAASANSDDPLYIGAGTASGSSTISERFSGKLDELFVNNRALGDAEIERSYYNQFRWFRKQYDAYLQVDTDAPTIDLLNADDTTFWAGYWPNEPVQLAVSTSDASSKIWSFEYGLARHNSLDLTWQSAPRCAGADESVWCISFDPRTLDGEGLYTLKFRAVDAVGNQTTTDYYSLTVDNTAPTISTTYSNSWLDLTSSGQDELSWSVSLTGIATDPTLAWSAGGFSTSILGQVDATSIAVSLIDATGSVAGKGVQYATLAGDGWGPSTWSLDYTFVGTRPSGVYTVRVSASDRVGNTATTDVGTIILDARPPSAEAQTAALPEQIIGAGTTLTGVLNEQPTPADAVARFHFEETSGSSFADYSDSGNNATCSSCPTSTPGLFGQALQFTSASALTVPTSTTLELSLGTLSAWVKPTWVAGSNGYNPAILGVRSPGGTRFSWHIRDNYTAIDLWNGTSVGSLPISITPGQWYHLALVQTGSSWTGYLNGVAIGTVEQSFGAQSGLPLVIGASGSGSEYFTGSIDEVSLFERALSAEEIYALAQSQVSGGATIEVALVAFTTAGAGSESWQSATLAQSGTGLATWSYAVPSNLEGFYQIKLRGEDTQDNSAEAGTVWSGGIDTQAPRVTLSAAQRFGGSLASTEYKLSVADLFLDPDTLLMPCASTDLTLSNDADFGRVDGATATCQQLGHMSAPVTITACDYAGNCASQTVTPTPTTGEPAISIDTPSTSVFTGTGSIAIGGVAYASSGIQTITLSANGSIVDTLTYPATPAETSWQTTWTPPAPGSYALTATVSSAVGSGTDNLTLTINRATAPGGVGSNLGLWLRADAGLAVSSDGAAVSSWTEQAQGWQAQNSADLPPTLNLDALNFNPALSFGASGISELNLGANYISAPPGSSGLTVFVVADPSASSGTRHLLLDVGRYNTNGYGISYSADDLNFYNVSTDTGGSTIGLPSFEAWPPPETDTPALLTYGITFATGSSLNVNGQLWIGSSNTALTRLDAANIDHSASHAPNTGPLTIGRQAKDTSKTERYFRGDIAEVILYSAALSDVERAQVESYLALKYGLTLTDGQSYLAASGATIWDAVANSAYHHDVAGIGRDDATSLDQRSSRGINSDALLTIGSPVALASNGNFLVWGNNDAALTMQGEVGNAGAYDRLARIWRVAETGETSGLNVRFDLAGLGLARNDTEVALLIDDDGDFANATVHTSGRSVAGDVVSFSGVDLENGQHISLLLRQRPELTISNGIAPASARSGDTVTLAVQFRNTGLVTATDVTVSLPLPATLNQATYSPTLDQGVTLTPIVGQSVGWHVGSLAAGAGGTISVTARLDAALSSVVSATATISASDDVNLSNNSATASLTVANRAPTLATIADASTDEGTELRFTAVASDSDLPAQTLSFSLVEAPAGATIEPNTGLFRWTPDASQGPGSYTFRVRVSDGELNAEQQVTITVRDKDQPNNLAGVQMSTVLLMMKPGESHVVRITLRSEPKATVRIALRSDTPLVCSVAPGSIELDATSWQTGMSVTIMATSVGACTISAEVESDDPDYADSPISPINITVQNESQRIYLPLLRK